MFTDCSIPLGDAPLKSEAGHLGITLGLISIAVGAGLFSILIFVLELCGRPSKGRYVAQILESYAAFQIIASVATQHIGAFQPLELTARGFASYWDVANLLTAGYNIVLLTIGTQYLRSTYRLMFHRVAIIINSLCLIASGIACLVLSVSGSSDSELPTGCSELSSTSSIGSTATDQNEWHTSIYTAMISLVCIACGGAIQGCMLRSTDTPDTYLRIRRSGIITMTLAIGGAIYCIIQTAPAFAFGPQSDKDLKNSLFGEGAVAAVILTMPLYGFLLFQCMMLCIGGRRGGEAAAITPERAMELGNMPARRVPVGEMGR